MSRLKERYQKEVVPALTKEFGYKNVMAVPKIEKVVVNMGLGEATANIKLIDVGADELGRVAVHRNRLEARPLRRHLFRQLGAMRVLVDRALLCHWLSPLGNQLVKGMSKPRSSALASASLFAEVTMTISMPRTVSTRS